ncbi:OB-fold domain-containing protein [Nocardia sp. NPDC048505]|uniref:Zn-ribbon domain-containing OB-fold protein n=1 Tax=unclassified Nocardia TaxID=2637762 RepID=UPI0033E77D88
MTARPIDAGLMELSPAGIRLLGCRCADCGETDFPARDSCRRCGGDRIDPVRLGTRGTLWSWTVQRFPPPSPPYVPRTGEFSAFGVGYVELPGEVIVESVLTTADAATLRIGMPMRLTTVEVLTHCGERTTGFAFEPLPEGVR